MTVDGAVAVIGQKIDPTTAVVEIDGVPLPMRPDLVYYLLYKPPGVISTASDDRERQTVVDLVPAEPRVFPVGRLDADSEGLLLLTNDGELTNLVTHPRFGVHKTYVAMVEGTLDRRTLRRLVTGVELEDGPVTAVSATVEAVFDDRTLVEVVMQEGRNRVVRRLLDALGHPVTRLVRTAIGPLRDRDLAPGAWRHLTLQEVRSLYSAASGPWEDRPQSTKREE